METNRVLYLLGPEHVEIREERVCGPAAGEMLIRIEAATTCGTDLKVFQRGGHPRMLKAPCAFGHEFTGTIHDLGEGVADWAVGDAVVVSNSASCGRCPRCLADRENLCDDLQYLNGAFADYLLVPQRFVRRSTHRRPEELVPEIAALTEPLACVFHGLARCRSTAGGTATVIGAGPIGLMFVAELTRRGWDVVLGDLVSERLEVGRLIGAKQTVQLSGEEGDTDILRKAGGGEGAPLVIEATGAPTAWQTAVEGVAVGGEVILFGGCAPGTMVEINTHRLHYSEITVAGVYHYRPEDFRAALARLASHSADLGLLIQDRQSLEGVEGALHKMAERKILKACITP